MAKSLLFFRGPKTERRTTLVGQLRLVLPETFWIAMDQIDPDPKRAHSRCMLLTKEKLQDPSIKILAIDNESFLPIHWQAYYAVAERSQIQTFTIGIDILDESIPEQLNLQLQNCPMFIASVDKYWCVKTNADSEEVGMWLETMRRD